MRGQPIDGAEFDPWSNRAQPLYLQSAERRLFGWLNGGVRGPLSGTGLLICPPFGYEAVCAHRTLRVFAEAAAALGVSVLRFDFAGTGDSDDLDADADQIEIWTDDVVAATRELRRLTGVTRVGVLGLRLGALLAALAIERGAQAHGLMALAPVVSGPRYLKELRRSQLMARHGAEPALTSDSLEFSGFSLSPRTVATLSRVDLAMRPPPTLSEIHILDRSDLPSAVPWQAMLAARGMSVRYDVSSGFVEMMLTPPYDAGTPAAVTQRVCEFARAVGRFVEPRSELAPPAAPTSRSDGSCETRLFRPSTSPVPGFLSERAVYLSRDPWIFGIVTTPDPSEKRRRAVILLNDGATYHIGASRLNVLLARRWAQRGYYVLRLDLAGLGDSSTRPGAEEDEVFPLAALDDIQSAIEYLRREYGSREVTLAGLCSGAYHCLRAAAAGLPVDRILMINTVDFMRSADMGRDSQIAADEVLRNPGLYLGRILSPKYWRRVLSGEVDLWRIVRIYAGRLRLAIEGVVRDCARRLRIRMPRDLGWELEDIASRGVRIVFVFARGETGIEMLRILGGSSLARLGDRCRVRLVDEADHIFSRSRSRAVLEDILSEELFVRHDRPPFQGGDAPAMNGRRP